MIATLKFLHLFSLLLGGAAAGGNTVLGELVRRSGNPPPPLVATAMGILLKTGFVAIFLLWLTGLPLTHLLYGDFDLGSLFNAKLVFATVVLGLSQAMNMHATSSRKKGKPPNAVLMRRLGMGTGLSMVLAIVLAAVVFATNF